MPLGQRSDDACEAGGVRSLPTLHGVEDLWQRHAEALASGLPLKEIFDNRRPRSKPLTPADERPPSPSRVALVGTARSLQTDERSAVLAPGTYTGAHRYPVRRMKVEGARKSTAAGEHDEADDEADDDEEDPDDDAHPDQ
jgi:hypothetical protein